MWECRSLSQSHDEEAGTSLTGGGGSTAPLLERNDSLAEEERERKLKIQELPGYRVDRGAGFYQEERIRHKRPCLVESGKHAGRSRVKREGIAWTVIMKHILKRDFFNAAVNGKLYIILLALCALYTTTILVWATMYFTVWRLHPNCFLGFTGPVSALLFSIETQQTIGYGTRSPNDCWEAAFLIAFHSLAALLMDSMIIGIAFARISHPKNRGRTILLSDSAVIARRDGVLKFMFRVADMQKSQVLAPTIHCFLYLWGDGRVTAEGEHSAVLVQELSVQWNRTLLLPATVEHVIDESSPLFGMTQKILESLGAEIVVEFEGSTELGDMFMVRQSYLAHEIHWGHVFCGIIGRAPPGETQHSVDLSKFHDVEPQPGLEALPPYRLSAKVVSESSRALPPPALFENTLVLSDEGVVGSREGRVYLMFRLGDRYPAGQVQDVRVEAFLYRWMARVTQEGEAMPFDVERLILHPQAPCLRYPVVLTHEICEGSPIAGWTTRAGKRLDADCEIVVTVRGTLSGPAQRQRLVTRTRVYPIMSNIRWGATFAPMVSRLPTPGTAHIDWPLFHLSSPTEVVLHAPTAAMRNGSSLSRASSGLNLQAMGQQQQQPAGTAATARGGGGTLSRATSGLNLQAMQQAQQQQQQPQALAVAMAPVLSMLQPPPVATTPHAHVAGHGHAADGAGVTFARPGLPPPDSAGMRSPRTAATSSHSRPPGHAAASSAAAAAAAAPPPPAPPTVSAQQLQFPPPLQQQGSDKPGRAAVRPPVAPLGAAPPLVGPPLSASMLARTSSHSSNAGRTTTAMTLAPGGEETWRDTRSLFAALSAMQELAREEQQQQEEQQAHQQ